MLTTLPDRALESFRPFPSLYDAQGLISVIFGKLAGGQPLKIGSDGSAVRDYVVSKMRRRSWQT